MFNVTTLAEHAFRCAKLIIERSDQELMPVWLIQTRAGKMEVVSTPWRNNEEKFAAYAGIRQALETTQAEHYAHVSEAWMLERKGGWDGERPSQAADRVEVLIVTAFARGGRNYMIIADIKTENGRRTVSEPRPGWGYIPPGDERAVYGAAVDLFRPERQAP